MLENLCCKNLDAPARMAAENSPAGFFSNLFDTSSYPPRWECGQWSSLEGWLHIGSDLGIFAAYFTIPLMLIYSIRKRRDIPFTGLLSLFSGFILLCGTSHFLEAVIFYWPAYRIAGIVKLATAIVSIITAITLYRILPNVLELPRLVIINDELRKADSAKSEFLANMSHEIRTPMTAILGFADLLLESKSESERTEYAGTIRRNGEHLLAVLNDILDLSKIEAGKLQIETLPCNLHGLISDVVDLQTARAEAKGLWLRIGIVDDCPEIVQTDPVRLRQIMLNLVGNAVKFTEQGGIEVLVETREISSDDPAVQKSELRLSVVDSGIGMTDDQLSRVFTAFSQADGSTSRQFGGTGLGLAISRRLVELLGGEIHVDSEYGMGSTFTVIIPITATPCKLPIRLLPPSATQVTVSPKLAPPTKLTPSTPSAAKKLSDAMILLVEDGIDNQRLISHVLKHAGAQVDVAANGQIALDLIHQGKKTYDVVLMDMQMPVLDGYHATRQLRQEGYDMPIVALTAHAMADDQARCLEAGCDDFLTKPINRVAIVDVLGKQLARRCSEVD